MSERAQQFRDLGDVIHTPAAAARELLSIMSCNPGR